ncbi:CMP-N-acetylneuraminate-beta-galactosamide-alpha-2,3-sialyltransferase 1 [Callorhinchus milii]|uniref:CMP-N-acetylneuraminate-beta-galactosamide- alpha-2,3-sialyltransferase 1 n=1 Tax=Callorhinchus milii TaxID=7868 RepID=UPI001C3F6FC6|nr:CMP-N-acetylneuraminate-beta-galactosamide-alpha-2,3-sialyltransferase 1 [Callorhinchus milii]XP_007907432.2 CMP-N-acetylneuraminate-beta-galactosamide-alpha-2,3-sialyltransferase 1 [Callorhinchus milii]
MIPYRIITLRGIRILTTSLLCLGIFLCSYTYYYSYNARWDGRLCHCERCVSELGLSNWFDKRFIPDHIPLLTRTNYTLTKETRNWWMQLQKERKPDNLSQVIAKLFELGRGEDNLLIRRHRGCRTCAVVGNSGNLLGSRYGKDIDANEIVFRMNQAVTKGFQQDVGSRTTHHFMYPESARDLENNTHVILIPFKVLDIKWIISALTTGEVTRTYKPVKRRIKVNKDKILVYHPHFFKYVYENWNQRHGRTPSTGMLAIIFALHVCDQVNVYGFGCNSKGHWHHYWEQNKGAGAFRITGVHNADFEANVTKILTNIQKVTFHPGI